MFSGGIDGNVAGAGGGIRTHEGLRHGIAHPRFCKGINRIDTFAVWGLECSARVLGATRPFGQMFDLTLVPPQSGIPLQPSQICLKALHFDRRLQGPLFYFLDPRERYYCSNAPYPLYRALSMSQPQTRKQKILGDVKRKRRQRALTTLTIVIVLISVIVVAVALFPRNPNLVPLPDYLSHCVYGSAYHSHPNLTITINGANFPFPPAPGTFDSGCPQPIHTHDATGVLHIETDQNRDYTLGDWFLLWGHWANNPTTAIFNSTQIFDHKVTPGHTLNMTVNGITNTQFNLHVFPHNAAPNSSLCTVPATGCVQDDIIIKYS